MHHLNNIICNTGDFCLRTLFRLNGAYFVRIWKKQGIKFQCSFNNLIDICNLTPLYTIKVFNKLFIIKPVVLQFTVYLCTEDFCFIALFQLV